jgi:uncharacterized membrane protein
MEILREFVALIGLLTPCAYLWKHWQSIPAVLPIHYDLQGQPNGFAAKGAIWMLVGLSIFMYLFLLVIAKFERYFNLPRPVGDPDRARYEALARELVAWLRLEIAWVFAFVVLQTVRAANGDSRGLGELFTPVVVAILLLTCAAFVWRMHAIKSPTAAS